MISSWGIKKINQNLMLTQSSRPINKSMLISHFCSEKGCFTEPPLHNWILTNIKSPLRNNKLSSVRWRANIFHVCYNKRWLHVHCTPELISSALDINSGEHPITSPSTAWTKCRSRVCAKLMLHDQESSWLVKSINCHNWSKDYMKWEFRLL